MCGGLCFFFFPSQNVFLKEVLFSNPLTNPFSSCDELKPSLCQLSCAVTVPSHSRSSVSSELPGDRLLASKGVFNLHGFFFLIGVSLKLIK